MIRRRVLGAICVLASAGLLAGCAVASDQPPAAAPDVSQVAHRDAGKLTVEHLAAGLIPPTNRWFSGLVFGHEPQPVFPLPLSFGVTATGFAFVVPDVQTSADTITGSFAPQVTVDAGAKSYEVSAYDEASVHLRERDGAGHAIGTLALAEGSPLVSFTAARPTILKVGPALHRSDGVWSASAGGQDYAVTGGKVSDSGVSLRAGATATFVAAPKGADLAGLLRHAAPVTSTTVSYRAAGSGETTTLRYGTARGASTLIATMPHQRSSLRSPADCDLGGYESVYGTMTLCSGTELTWSVPRQTPSDSLPVDRLTDAQKAELTEQVDQDAAATAASPADTYAGGKALYRLANLLQLSAQLGDDATTAKLRDRLASALTRWTDPKGCTTRDSRCFVYDPKSKGMIGLTASFGTDQFNDHHFHYGYFLYAAAVAVRQKPGLLDTLRPVVDLIAADIGSVSASKDFPAHRTFDAYAGHSWASGTAPFADGNDQESSSEAVSAWNGLALWAAATKDSDLRNEAVWMLSAEAASARAYWVDFDRSSAVYDGYDHSVASLNWGAKRDYATWFSADANAKLAIQLIPMSPAAGYLGGNAGRIADNLAEAAPGGYDVQFGDYLLMYSALQGGDQASKAQQQARDLPEKSIDDADSRSYLLAWTMTRSM